ncbi:hypothetical protein GCM10011531_23420 [Aquaticitalea lipolytica]|uniref:Uncharacterized protein n=1 Tax=Aquaticitalea lipolytica TaxID=1247562 RepID=A0A8J2XAI8_9FLAO|nr:hypothetical protein [Aquaticitalea lipolytica]GFZ90987.1 hypothetical protein GCM10011531_23420 [Aquaticitalea lipolytica]
MKLFTILLSVIALGLIAFNATKLNFDALFEGESIIAIITIVASLCVIILMQILRTSKRIEQLSKRNNN